MIEEQARVVRLDGSFAEIAIEKRPACGSCAAKTGCGTSILAAWFPQRQLRFRLRNDVGARSGDRVVVGLDEGMLQRSSMLLYAFPLVGLLLGAIAGERVFEFLALPAELGAVLIGLLGLIAALLLVRLLTTGARTDGDIGVKLLRVARQPLSLVPGDIPLPGTKQSDVSRTYE
jgi:sigma-E factor negative regulatory protein RseC